jgi:YegS/Rv2252/BmrU family lipid kinase
MHFFIINPNAGTNKASDYTNLIEKIRSNNSNIILETKGPTEATSLAHKAIQQGASRIIAVGGDGTINEVASALVNTNTPLGIIPLGSGNGLARHLNIPLNPLKALAFATNYPAQKMDVGKFNERYFFCTAGIGFDASVAHRFAKGSGRGFINYIKATLSTIFTYKPIQVAINNSDFRPIFSLTIANANQFGNNAYISPHSSVQDGLLEVIKIKKLTLFQATIIGIRLFMGNIHQSKMIEISSAKELTIKYLNNAPFHLDGEQLFTETEDIKIQLLPAAIHVIC